MSAGTVADILNVPAAIMDAVKISGTSFVGNDIKICLQQLLAKATGNIKPAERGVAYIDEIGKLARAGEAVDQPGGAIANMV